MTKQEYYDLLVKTSLDGGFPAKDYWSDGCKYLAKDGKKCAVGLLIPEDKYDKDLDWLGPIYKVYERHKELIDSILPENITVNDLELIQGKHDSHLTFCGKNLTSGNWKEWDHKVFVDGLNSLNCFSDIQQVKV